MSRERTFCPIPWSYSIVSTNGAMKSCSTAYSTERGGALTGPDHTELHVNTADLDAARNAPELLELRKNMLAGQETPAICQRCIEEESQGLQSRRELERVKNYVTPEQAVNWTADDGSIDPKASPLNVFNLRLGNLCNLSCRMCHPAQSSGWYEEWFKTRYKGFKDSSNSFELHENSAGKIVLKDSPYRWYEQDRFWKYILSHRHELKELHFSGGEPLLSSEHIAILRELADKGLSQDIVLDYNSNLTTVPPKLLELWPKFRKVTIGISLEGVGRVNDYIRYPSRFEKAQKNIALLEALPGHIQYWITSTISILNVGSYTDLIDWILASPLKGLNRHTKEDSDRFLSAHVLRAPTELSIQSLPPKAKRLVRSKYEDFLSRQSAQSEYLCAHVEGILKYMEAGDSVENCYRFYIETTKSDRYRKQDFASIDREIWNSVVSYLKDTGQLPQADKMAEQRWW